MTKRLLSALLLLMICLTATTAKDNHRFTLVIDAGHGGHDGGACANGAKEKNINLSVALAFGNYVETNCPDVKVIYTRKTDVFIPLHERADIANKNKADVFISIHTNSVESRRPVTGLETYTMGLRRSDEKRSAAMRENEVVLIESDFQQHYAGFDPRVPESYIIFDIVNENNMAESVALAQLIQQHVCATAGRPNKGVKQDAFLVLRETSMPACLVELGYITTASEATFLTNASNVDAMARGLYQAFAAYKNQHTSNVAPLNPTPANPTPATTTPTETNSTDTDAPVFKVQVLASSTQLSTTDRQLKGLANVECYKEGNLWKYTVGSSTDYDAISQLRRDVLELFPQAFIVAFKRGERVDTSAAIQEYRNTHQ